MHKPVLLHEVVEGLDLGDKSVFVDGTYGAGGHTGEVIRRYGDKVRVISIDQDPEAHADITGNFREIDTLLGNTHPDAILLDLGFSSDQLDTSGRGLTFQKDEPLDMRLSGKGVTAADILNSWDEHAIELILRGFGEEKFSQRIASAIVKRRELKPYETTSELVETIVSSTPAFYRHGKIHPATRTFQALRIAVNDELTALEEGLEKGWKILNPHGRFVVISFHSLEDRIVKNFFRDKAKNKEGKLITKKPVVATREETLENPRSRSAKLRIIEKNV